MGADFFLGAFLAFVLGFLALGFLLDDLDLGLPPNNGALFAGTLFAGALFAGALFAGAS